MCPNFPWFMSTLVLDFGAQLYEIFKHCAYETKMTRKQLVYFKLHNWGTKHNVKFHCLISNSEGLGMCLYIKGLATIDPHSHKVQTKLFKIPKFGVKRPNSKQDTAIWKCQNLQRNVMSSGHSVQMAIHFSVTFLNRYISVKTCLINTKLGNLVNLGVLFLTMWINSC